MIRLYIVCFVVFIYWAPAFAAKGVPFGAMTAYPEIGLAEVYDDNITNSTNRAIDSFVTVVKAGVRLEFKSEGSLFIVSYKSELGEYEATDEDDYFDQSIGIQWDVRLGRRNRISIDGQYKEGSDPRGTGSTEGIADDLNQDRDTWESGGLSARYMLGSEQSKGRFELIAKNTSKDYTNNRITTFFLDRVESSVDGRFSWQIRPKTDMLFETRFKSNEYDNSGSLPSLDSDELRFFVGARWSATGKTIGSVRMGHTTKEFDSNSRNDFSGVNWKAGIEYFWKSYSSFNFETSREPRETNGTGDFIDHRDYKMTWRHRWSSRFNTDINVSYAQDSFDPDLRDDDRVGFGLKASFSARHWLELNASYRYLDLDSTRNIFDYSKNVFMLGATGSL